jgi:Rps23 Pro-64 3,4-dihydroxylase Tpa1-like proline 4-hydroxylase
MNLTETVVQSLSERAESLNREWLSKEPFKYLVADDFLPVEFAEEILSAYPQPEVEGWDNTTYIHQRKKFTKTRDFPQPIAQFFTLVSEKAFVDVIGQITGIPKLLHDPELVGGGLHQIIRGGFLDVHVDYNYHPRTKLHRRLNLLLYLNKNWKREYEGCLELWDMESKRQLASIEPIFNRAVIFETNEISFHGHPRPLNSPQNVTRKSLAIYYYTAERAENELAPEHNTIYKQTTGASGYAKTTLAATAAAIERAGEKGFSHITKNIINKVKRKAAGLPPENKIED